MRTTDRAPRMAKRTGGPQRSSHVPKREPASPPRWRAALPYAGVALVAFAMRAIVAAAINGLPINRDPQYDSLEYLLWARRLASGDFTWPVTPPHGPGYPFFLGLTLAITNGSLLGVRIVQAIVGVATCVLTALTASRLFGRRAGIAAGALLAIYAPLIWIDVSILAEGLLICILAAVMWCVASERPLIAAALLGLATLVRPTSLIFLPLVLIFAATTWRTRVIAVAIVALIIAPVTIANAVASHAFIPVQAFGGMNIYLGDSPQRDGLASARPGGEWDGIEAAAARAGVSDIASEDRFFIRKTISEIQSEPLAFVRLLVRKMIRTFQSDEVRDTNSFYFFQQFAPLLRWLLSFTLLFALAVAGATVLPWRERRTWLVAGYVVFAALTCIAFVVGSRYRMPMVIGLAIAGGVAIARALEERTPRRLAMLAIVALVAGACTRAWRHEPSHNFAEEWALTAQALLKEQQASDAESAARQAVDANSTNALAWNALGSVYALSGRTAAAGDAFAKAASLNPDFAKAHLHLAQFAIDSGDIARAASEYERVVEIDPRDVKSLWALARLQGALGHPDRGFEFAQRAARLREPDGDEWMIIAMLALDSGHFDVSAEAIANATAITGTTPQTMFATALLRYRQGRLDDAEAMVTELLAQQPGLAEAQQLRTAIEQAKRR